MKDSKTIEGHIQIYSMKARDRMVDVSRKFLNRLGLVEILDDLFSCVDELIKNAVKANYKYILLKDKVIEQITKSNQEKSPELRPIRWTGSIWGRTKKRPRVPPQIRSAWRFAEGEKPV